MVWLNVDKPEKKCTIHTDPDCTYVVNMEETEHKGIGTLKRDGGWLEFDTEEDAKAYCGQHFPNYDLSICC